MSILPPRDSHRNSSQARKLNQPHLIHGSSPEPRSSVPVHYIRENRRSILLPLLSFFAVCLIVILFFVGRLMRQGQNVSHATAVVGKNLAGVAQRQDTTDTKLAKVDGQVQTLKKRVGKVETKEVVHDRAIRDLKGRILLPPDYDPKVPLPANAKIHHVGPTIQDWTLKVDKPSGGNTKIEVAPIRVTPQGTEVYVMKGNTSAPVEEGAYYLFDS